MRSDSIARPTLGLALWLCASVTFAAEVRVTNLRCEYLVDPLGIDVQGVTSLGSEDGTAVFHVASGSYTFVSTLADK